MQAVKLVSSLTSWRAFFVNLWGCWLGSSSGGGSGVPTAIGRGMFRRFICSRDELCRWHRGEIMFFLWLARMGILTSQDAILANQDGHPG